MNIHLYLHLYLPRPSQSTQVERTNNHEDFMHILTINNKDEYSQGPIFARKYIIASSKVPTQIGIFTTYIHMLSSHLQYMKKKT